VVSQRKTEKKRGTPERDGGLKNHTIAKRGVLHKLKREGGQPLQHLKEEDKLSSTVLETSTRGTTGADQKRVTRGGVLEKRISLVYSSRTRGV